MTSRSFMDAIKSVGRKSADLTEGAKDKTSDGMTKDAKHFAQDLHKVQDPGVKHLVQKDSEAKDYEKMFKPDIEKFPTRPADMEPSQSVDKYVEYNEAVHMEAKKLSKKDDQKTGDNPDNEDATGPLTNEAKKCGKDCKCEDCKTVAEIYVNPTNNTPAAAALRKSQSGPNASTLPTQAGQGPASPMRNQGTSGAAKPPERAQQAAPVSRTLGRGGSTGGRYGMQRPEISKPDNQPYGMNIPKKSPTLKAQMDGKITDRKPAPGHSVDKPPKVSSPRPSEAGATGDATSKDKNNVARDKMYSGSTKPDLAKPEKQPYGIKPGLSKPGGQTQQPYGMNGPSDAPPKPTAKPADGGSKPSAPQKFTSKNGLNAPDVGGGAKPGAAKPPSKPQSPSAGVPRTGGTRNNDVGPSAKPRGGVATGKTIIQQNKPRAKAPVGTNPLKSHYEIEWNGNSYLMNEAQIEALSVFIEKYGQVNEVITSSTSKDEMIHDFVHSKNPKFDGKPKEKRIQQALAAYRAKHGK